jgi:hypothetical protein
VDPLLSSEASPRPQSALTAIIVVGEMRDRAQQVVDRLYAQTAADSMEIVIVDLGRGGHPPLRISSATVPTQYIERSAEESWGEVKAAGARAASGQIVAFVEDHSIPTVTWAEAIIRASSRPWVAAGYAFINANPGRGISWKAFVSWAGFIADYGPWAHPLPPGPARHLPCNNVAYRRKEIIALGPKLGGLLHSDSSLQEYFARQGKPTEIIRDAVVAHQNHEEIGVLFDGNFVHCRLIAACRVEQGHWGWLRRWGYALAVPVVVPFMKLGRLLRPQLRRRDLWGVVLGTLPIALALFFWSSLGEALGYLFGLGNSLRRFQQVEVSVARSTELKGENP